MGRTRNLNTIGMGAHNEKKAWAAYIAEEYDKHIEQVKKNHRDFDTLLNQLKYVDPDWEAWYDGPAIPTIIHWSGDRFDAVIETITARIVLKMQPKIARGIDEVTVSLHAQNNELEGWQKDWERTYADLAAGL